MAAFQCNCGESLVAPEKGILRCWFCSNEYIFPRGESVVSVNYEHQESRPVIRTLDVHNMGLVRKKKSGGVDI